jgi:hypothetical protein
LRGLFGSHGVAPGDNVKQALHSTAIAAALAAIAVATYAITPVPLHSASYTAAMAVSLSYCGSYCGYRDNSTSLEGFANFPQATSDRVLRDGRATLLG